MHKHDRLAFVFAALSSRTLPTWYKALFEILIDHWEGIEKELSKPAALETAGPALDNAGQCGKIFSALIQVTKGHIDKQVLVLHLTV